MLQGSHESSEESEYQVKKKLMAHSRSFVNIDICCLIVFLTDVCCCYYSTSYVPQPDLIKEFKVSLVKDIFESNVCFWVCCALLWWPTPTISQVMSI